MKLIKIALLCNFMVAIHGGCTPNEDHYQKISQEKKSNPPNKQRTCDSETSTLLSKMAMEAQREVAAIADGIPESCKDTSHLNFHLCKEVEVGFFPKEGKSSSRGQRILIMDVGFHIPALTRYHSRVLDFLEFTPRDYLGTITERLIANQAANSISKLLDEKYPELPSVLFTSFLKKLADKIPEDLWFTRRNKENFGHGTSIFTKLAEYNPYAEFVLIDDENFSVALEWYGVDSCKFDQGDVELNKYKNFIILVSNKIISLVKKHDINFIGFAFSPNIQSLGALLKNKCKKEFPHELLAKMLQIDLEHFFKPIYSIPGVISVQAVLPTGTFYIPTEQADNRVDCTTFKNRLRVGAFGIIDSQIPIEGTSDTKYMDRVRGSLPCTDLAVNLGEPWHGRMLNPIVPECFVHSSYNPFLRPAPPDQVMANSSSYAVPIVLSYLIYLKNTLMVNTPIEEIIRIATSGGKDFIKDPIRHRQIEVYRLGYLDP